MQQVHRKCAATNGAIKAQPRLWLSAASIYSTAEKKARHNSMDENRIFPAGSQHQCPFYMDTSVHMKQQVLMNSQEKTVVKDEVPLPLSHC